MLHRLAFLVIACFGTIVQAQELRLIIASRQVLRTDEQGDICLRLPTKGPVEPCGQQETCA